MTSDLVTDAANADRPRGRIVLLGASNLARAAAVIVEESRRVFGGPLDVVLAMGHGRSYGLTTSAPMRSLPSILDCGLWDYLASAPPLPTQAIITDIGNDIIYGMTPPELAVWVRECVERLRRTTERIVVTVPPLAVLQNISKLRFYTFRSILFPRSPLRYADAKPYALGLDREIRELAAAMNLPIVEPNAEWYGIDPIHIRFRKQREAWRYLLTLLRDAKEEAALFASERVSWWTMHTMKPHRSLHLGRAREIAQPNVVLNDGTRVSFF